MEGLYRPESFYSGEVSAHSVSICLREWPVLGMKVGSCNHCSAWSRVASISIMEVLLREAECVGLSGSSNYACI
jgi:hypothetical protein